MSAFRNLRHSRSSFLLLPRCCFNSSLLQGFGGRLRHYSDQKVLRVEDEVVGDEVERIRREFDAARRSFLKIPHTLNSMPKMNTEGIYVNKNLRLDNVQVYGFDYDYTLAHYSDDVQSLIYDLAKEHLVNELRYPESCLKFKYDPNFPIRGLYYDKLKGCLLKLDFFGSIEPDGCFFGRRKLKREEIIEMYGTRHIGRHQAQSLVSLMDFFCFSEVKYMLHLFAGLLSFWNCFYRIVLAIDSVKHPYIQRIFHLFLSFWLPLYLLNNNKDESMELLFFCTDIMLYFSSLLAYMSF